MRRLVVAFDCDGTLTHTFETARREAKELLGDQCTAEDVVSLLRDGGRGDVIQLLREFAAQKETYEVIVHSGGGGWYAESYVRKFGLSELVERCEAKDFRNKYDICIDDMDHDLGIVNIRV